MGESRAPSMIWLAFVGGGMALRSGAHMGVDSLERSFKRTPHACARRNALIMLVCSSL